MKNVALKPPTSEQSHGTMLTYTTGFLLSVILTLIAYSMVTHHSFSKSLLLGAIVVLAVTQFAVQMVFFLHLGKESKPRWNLTAFLFMLTVLFILVFGSLWIMHNLNYHTDHNSDQDIIKDEGLQPE